ncbi:MAG: rod shape-determining protein MreD [Cyanobacteria bacterium P01_F01_bin.42]
MTRSKKTRQLRRQPVLRLYNPLVIVSSVLICTLLSLTRWPGMVLSGYGPGWLVIWLGVWCIDRTLLQAIAAGLCLGWIQDSLSAGWPSHTVGMITIGTGFHFCFANRVWKSDLLIAPIIVAIGVFVNDVIFSMLLSWSQTFSLIQTWRQASDLFWISPLLSAVWTPAFFWPLRQWWTFVKKLQS